MDTDSILKIFVEEGSESESVNSQPSVTLNKPSTPQAQTRSVVVAMASVTVSRARGQRFKPGSGAIHLSDPFALVTHGMVSVDVANQVWLDCLTAWGMEESDADARDELLDGVTHACLLSTSKSDENFNSRFVVGSEEYKLSVIADAMSRYSAVNDSHLRVFVRSFDGGRIAFKIYETLKDPENVEIRSELAMRCGGPVEHAHLMCDVMDAVIKTGVVFSASELALIQRYRNSRTAGAAMQAQSVGLPTSTVDRSAHREVERQKGSGGGSAPDPVANRLNFNAFGRG